MYYNENDNLELTDSELEKIKDPHCFWCGIPTGRREVTICPPCNKRRIAYKTLKKEFNRTPAGKQTWDQKSYDEAYNVWFNLNYKDKVVPDKVWS